MPYQKYQRPPILVKDERVKIQDDIEEAGVKNSGQTDNC